jgi:hypothetical protein
MSSKDSEKDVSEASKEGFLFVVVQLGKLRSKVAAYELSYSYKALGHSCTSLNNLKRSKRDTAVVSNVLSSSHPLRSAADISLFLAHTVKKQSIDLEEEARRGERYATCFIVHLENSLAL